ncbi:hypothetical protein [Gracilibacillus massiliensis]|uniref:hypothetical protein n=1 Tax=Gracilibacillus massiliensis TaxID=1564956 RepID=UPI00071CD690|nr:hypothetical protein [Gracilibacillus massiliensis]
MKKIYVLMTMILLLFIIPIFWWKLTPHQPLDVAIIDQTVPDNSYREHQGITWFLNHFKYTNKDKQAYSVENDYLGYDANRNAEGTLPNDYDDYDLIYLADTYGVYQDDVQTNEASREGARSSKIAGGLKAKEWQAIKERLLKDDKSTLIAEYNTFASPTDRTVMKDVTDYLGIEWTGWTGRYFDELDLNENQEIPKWVMDEYGEEWDYSGAGFLLVNDLDYQVIVLEADKHFEGEGIDISFTEEGQDLFGLNNSQEYNYWFDIIVPKSTTTVLGEYNWNLKEQGEEVLEQHQIPSQFAAVTKSDFGSSSSYYLAGDFNDVNQLPNFYQAKGLSSFYRLAQMFSDQAFYWDAYIPMMKAIVAEFQERSNQAENSEGSLQYPSRINENKMEVLKEDEWVSIPIKGVNMGMAKPGRFPGEAAIEEEEYYRWFQQIGEMNANTIRVYTLHPPGFYDALKRYNDSHEDPIYVMHGVWINELQLEETLDAFDEETVTDFQAEMKKIVDVIHGNRLVEDEVGHASGVYRADISEYVIGWIIGIEWYPFMVENTNEEHAEIGDYSGTYYQTENAQPFEYWLAEQMDLLTSYEIDQYQSIRPMSFTNWVTTDILEHPSDSTEQEDIVSVDPNVIFPKKEAEITGQFASYHIYPYYPDFLNYDQKYRTYIDHRGEENNYAGYLHELDEAHRLPILVAEFGVPSSRGLTHRNPFGWNQGFLSEQQQGEIVSRLFEDIMEEKMLGGLIFTWQDEWFKRTWNTMEYDNPDRRPYWSNAQTNEQQFGLLSFDRHKIQVDGEIADWEQEPLYQKQEGNLEALYVDHDERYLYVRLDYNQEAGYPVLLLDTVPQQGNRFFQEDSELTFSNGVEYLINLDPEESRMLIDTYYDIFTYQYGYLLDMIDVPPEEPIDNSGTFSKIEYALNKPYFLPDQDRTIPFESYETGILIEGNGNPEAENYHSLVDFNRNAEKGRIELRIPWLLIQAKDPSTKEFIGDLYQEGMDASVIIDQINLGVLYYNKENNLIDSLPALQETKLEEMKGYTWEEWQQPLTEERLKQSYFQIQDLFSSYD